MYFFIKIKEPNLNISRVKNLSPMSERQLQRTPTIQPNHTKSRNERPVRYPTRGYLLHSCRFSTWQYPSQIPTNKTSLPLVHSFSVEQKIKTKNYFVRYRKRRRFSPFSHSEAYRTARWKGFCSLPNHSKLQR